MKACFPYLRESRGTVVNFGSQVGLLATPGAHYVTGDTFNIDGGRCLRP